MENQEVLTILLVVQESKTGVYRHLQWEVLILMVGGISDMDSQ